MKMIRLYRNSACVRCAGYARMHHRFDWLGRFEDSTETAPTGALRIGEIAVQDLLTGVTLKGIACFRLLCKHIPAYWLVLPFTYVPPIRQWIENDIGGCADGSCEITPRATQEPG